MGYIKNDEIKEIKLSDPNYWVKVKTSLKWGDLKKFAAVSQGGDVDFATSATLFLESIIVEWNLDDDAGNIVPITAEILDKLDQADAIKILNSTDGLVETETQKKSSQSK